MPRKKTRKGWGNPSTSEAGRAQLRAQRLQAKRIRHESEGETNSPAIPPKLDDVLILSDLVIKVSRKTL
jgi:hypothetical protein